MFLYRPTPLNNRSRLIFAALLAVSLHIGFMNFEFDRKKFLVPTVSLPRSVSVFLRHSKIEETSILQQERVKTSEDTLSDKKAAEIEPEKPVLQKQPGIKDKNNNSQQQPFMLEKTIKQPAAETTGFNDQSSENTAKDLLTAPGETEKAQELATSAEPLAGQDNDTTTLPGTLQTAYPRYQLNSPPAYPGRARKRGQQGTVVLQVLVNTNGMVDDLEIETSSGFGSLDHAAAAAVRKWSFEPGRRGEEKIPMWVRVPVTFKLTK